MQGRWFGTELKTEQKQIQTLTPQMLQSIEILQMSSQELLDYTREQMLENPLLEQDDSVEVSDYDRELIQKIIWMRANDRQNRSYYTPEEGGADALLENRSGSDAVSLADALLTQLGLLELSSRLYTAARFVIYSLDERGWLRDEPEELAASTGIDRALLDEATQIVQGLDPAGIAARNLAECLILQLRRMDCDTVLAEEICRSCLDLLGKKRYDRIARQLKRTPAEVRQAAELIAELNPIPANGFSSGESPVYIIPDIFIVPAEGGFQAVLNERCCPQLHISDYYAGLSDGDSDKETKKYIAEQLRKAQLVIEFIDRRKATLSGCAESILRRQNDFFRLGRSALRPMSLADVAADTNVHESTVSRALKGKYLQCPSGIYPLSFFFSRSLQKAADAAQPDFTHEAVRARLKELLAAEDRRAPLSDQKLCELLVGSGFTVSRRTVAKYRDELGYAAASSRRER